MFRFDYSPRSDATRGTNCMYISPCSTCDDNWILCDDDIDMVKNKPKPHSKFVGKSPWERNKKR